MEKNKEFSKDAEIKKEIGRIKKIFTDMDKNKLKAAESLIKDTAFLAISMKYLQESINQNGFTDIYNNGGGQSGKKQSEDVKTYIAMSKNHAINAKILLEMTPLEKRKDNRFAMFRKEVIDADK